MLRGRTDPKKEEQERLQNFLLEMLKEEENKYCADCQAKTPRWAAWNLGIFICIRCAGIHRNLGVHISKVRSVNLDSWTPEQVQTMRVMGNEKARQVYEHDLPAQFRRPTSDNQMEQFIRSKYEQKRYMLRDFVYPKVDASELPKSLAQFSAKKTGHPVVNISAYGKSSTNGTGAKAVTTTASVNDLLDFSAPPAAAAPKTNSLNLFDGFDGLSLNPTNTPASATAASLNDDFDDFGSFVSANSTNTSTTNTQSDNFGGFADFSTAPTTANVSSNLADLTSAMPAENGGGIEQKKSNADILSLFGTSGTSTANATTLVAPGGFAGFGLQAAPQQQVQANSFAAFGTPAAPQVQNDLYGGLGGINFGGIAGQPGQPQNVNSFGGNGFGQTPLISQMGSSHKVTPTSPTHGQGFNIPNKTNAFADLALGKVMKTSYGQSALSSTTSYSKSPTPSSHPIPATTASASNDLFDMFSTAPPPVSVAVKSSSGLDDLLGL